MPKKVRRKSISAPFEVAESEVAVQHQAFALVEHRRVRRVVVGAVGAADDDDADRRLLGQHGADLHRRGLGAQHRRWGVALCRQVERVVVGARGMVRWDVERAEIHPVGFDVGAFGDRAAHGAEDRGDLLHGAADRVDQASLAGTRRQRGIEAFGGQAGVEFGVFQGGAAGFDEPGQRVLELVQRGSALAALLGRGLAEVAQQCGQASIAAKGGHADGVPGTQVGGGGKSGLGFRLQGGEIVGHENGTADARRCTQIEPRRRRQRDRPVALTGAGAPKSSGLICVLCVLCGSNYVRHPQGGYSAACTFLTISANEAASS